MATGSIAWCKAAGKAGCEAVLLSMIERLRVPACHQHRQASERSGMLSYTEHRKHKRLNNPAEQSHQPARQRERMIRLLKSSSRPALSLCPSPDSRPFLSTAASIEGHARKEKRSVIDAFSSGMIGVGFSRQCNDVSEVAMYGWIPRSVGCRALP